MKGTVVFRPSNVGSKSQGVFPFLYLGNANFVRIWKTDDISFEGNLLKPFDGKYVELQGAFDEHEVFLAETVKILYPIEDTQNK